MKTVGGHWAIRVGLVLLCAVILLAGWVSIKQCIDSGFSSITKNPKPFLVLLSAIAALGRLIVRQRSSSASAASIRAAYSEIIGEAFANDKDSCGLLTKALVHYNEDRPAKAVPILEKLLGRCVTNQESAATSFFLGLCQTEMNKTPTAIESYKAAIDKNPNLDSAHNNLGFIYKELGNFEVALRHFESAITINPNSPFPVINIAGVYLRMGKSEEAIQHALTALEKDATMYQAMNILAIAYTRENNLEKAEEYYQRSVINGCPDPAEVRQVMNDTRIPEASPAGDELQES